MSFLERLKWSTENALKNRLDIQSKIMKKEMENNERKLDSLQLLETTNEELLKHAEASGLLAEFMPMPGAIPKPKVSAAWAKHGKII